MIFSSPVSQLSVIIFPRELARYIPSERKNTQHKGNNCEIASRDIFFVSDSEMTDCVDGAETLGGPDLVTGLAPGLRMEDMALAEKLDRTLLSNTG